MIELGFELNPQTYTVVWAIATVLFIAVTSYLLGVTAKGIAKLFKVSGQEQNNIFWGFMLSGPWIVGFLIFVLGPALVSFYYGFTDYKIGGDKLNWIDLENYRTLLLGTGTYGKRFRQSLYNSFYYTLIGVPLQVMAALIMALLLNRKTKGISVFRTIYYLPVILATSPAALLAWRYMFAANGGFVNESMKKLAGSFVGFDYMYRGFIYTVEGLNGFYAGYAKGDPLGPYKFALPAILGVLILLALRGTWTDGKRDWAQRILEVLGFTVLGNMLANGLIAKHVNLSWTYVAGIMLAGMILLNVKDQKWRLVQTWQSIGIFAFVLSAFMTAFNFSAFMVSEYQRFEWRFDSAGAHKYWVAMGIALIPTLVSIFGKWDRRKFQAVLALIAMLGLIIFVRTAERQFVDGRADIFVKYLTLGSTMKNTTDAKYLDAVYPLEVISANWIYAMVLGVLAGLITLHKQERPRQILFYGALAFFVLFGLSAALDGRDYFQAFADIAEQAGKPNYHYALFHQATDDFPEDTRVPLWLASELWSKPSLILITMWSSGAGMLIFLAALKGVPNSLYEAAEVDGANTWQKFTKITLPMISPAIFYNIVIGVVAAMQTFESVYIIQTQQTESSLSSVAYFLYSRTFRELAIGQGAAASWILAVIIVAVTAIQFRYSKWVNYDI